MSARAIPRLTIVLDPVARETQVMETAMDAEGNPIAVVVCKRFSGPNQLCDAEEFVEAIERGDG